jgi:hypothetical protein
VLTGGVLTLLGAAVAVSALVWLHLKPTGLDPLRDAVSHYGITPFRVGYRVQTIAMAVSGLGAAIGLYSALHGDAAVVVAALAAFVAARAVISWLPMDEPGQLVTPRGAWHLLLALVAFIAIFIAELRLGRVLDRTDTWPDWQAASVPFDIAFVLGLVGMVVTRRLPHRTHVFGLAERFYYLAMLGWLVFVGFALVANA